MKATRGGFNASFLVGWCPQCKKIVPMNRIVTNLPGILAHECPECHMHYQANFLEDDNDIIELPDGWAVLSAGARVEVVNGRGLLCGCIVPHDCVRVGQEWSAASGSTTTVIIVDTKTVIDESGSITWVTYEGPSQPRHMKESFSFQCRYCLVLPGE